LLDAVGEKHINRGDRIAEAKLARVLNTNQHDGHRDGIATYRRTKINTGGQTCRQKTDFVQTHASYHDAENFENPARAEQR
jgi:hypothetical protein